MTYLRLIFLFFKATAWARWVLYALLGYGSLLGYGAYKHHQGYVDGKVACEKAVASALSAEAERQRIANEQAQEASRRDVDELLKEKSRLEQIIQENADAANKDSERGRCGIGADSVRRLNKVRRQ